jgi:hypothetical protein
MKRRDAKAQIDRDHPEMTTAQKIAAVKRLLADGPPHKPSRWPLAVVLVMAGALAWATVTWWHRDALLLVGAWVVMTAVLGASSSRYDRAMKRWANAQTAS